MPPAKEHQDYFYVFEEDKKFLEKTDRLKLLISKLLYFKKVRRF
jgi:hypothetical protein